jgi:hypothetical protein
MLNTDRLNTFTRRVGQNIDSGTRARFFASRALPLSLNTAARII